MWFAFLLSIQNCAAPRNSWQGMLGRPCNIPLVVITCDYVQRYAAGGWWIGVQSVVESSHSWMVCCIGNWPVLCLLQAAAVLRVSKDAH
jgi:hypothetical protein